MPSLSRPDFSRAIRAQGDHLEVRRLVVAPGNVPWSGISARSNVRLGLETAHATDGIDGTEAVARELGQAQPRLIEPGNDRGVAARGYRRAHDLGRQLAPPQHLSLVLFDERDGGS